MGHDYFSRTATIAMFIFALCCCTLLADDPPAQRRYDAGPLTADDFQATAPVPLPTVGRFKQLAFADTDIRYQMEYRYKNLSTGVEATLKDIDIYAIFLADKSWLTNAGAKTLDHEQGHFDISQMYALDAKLQMQTRLNDGKSLIGKGANRDEAVSDLHRQVDEFLKPLHARVATAHKEYDRDTNHGLLPANQTAHRKQQLDLLAKLLADLKELQPADKR